MSTKNKPAKAYNNKEFLNSADARTLRILSEYIDPESRFKRLKITDTVVFFGSARFISSKEAGYESDKLKDERIFSDEKFPKKLRHAQKMSEMSRYYDEAVELSEKLSKFMKSISTNDRKFVVCTGGGPGIMEAANKGAYNAGYLNAGLGISLPFEQGVNKYISPELALEFHYFFMRKFWLAYMAKAAVIFPGGFGTMDELFEILTLVQTKKMNKRMLIILYGEKFWKELINFDKFVEAGVISEEDLDLFCFCNTPDEAFEKLQHYLIRLIKD
ncbi:MAG: TIGR00730 family Rossman fold protein [Ignavibacteriaceae bacterium]|nr:TIGR00730 family Rossman fold protein [Ignavibacteriaceae bacterium]